jgi:hypothetical protein
MSGMTRTRTAAALLAAGLLALGTAGCGAGDDRPENERAYLDGLYDAASAKGSGIKGYGDQKNIDLANTVCDALSAGQTPEAVIANIEQDPARGVSEMAPDIVDGAQEHICDAE